VQAFGGMNAQQIFLTDELPVPGVFPGVSAPSSRGRTGDDLDGLGHTAASGRGLRKSASPRPRTRADDESRRTAAWCRSTASPNLRNEAKTWTK
jgi:hypothetical protein